MKIILIFMLALLSAVPTQASKIEIPAAVRESPSNPDQKTSGGEQEPSQAVSPSQDAGEGVPEAQFRLGLLFRYGDGASQDYQQAVVWFTKAVEQGNPGAQYQLGLTYYQSEEVEPNLVLAYKWATLAAAQAHEDAANLLEALRSRLTPSEINDAEKLIREFQGRGEAAR